MTYPQQPQPQQEKYFTAKEVATDEIRHQRNLRYTCLYSFLLALAMGGFFLIGGMFMAISLITFILLMWITVPKYVSSHNRMQELSKKYGIELKEDVADAIIARMKNMAPQNKGGV